MGIPNKRPSKAEFASAYKRDFEQIKKGNAVVFVVESKGRVMGECGVYAKRPDSDEGHVGGLDMSIIKEYRRMGMGTALLSECLKQSRKRFDLITTEVSVHNRVSLRLIKKFGFKIAGKIPHKTKRNGRYVSEYIAYLLIR